MARPQAEAKLNYYPIPPPVLDLVAARVEPPADPASCTILDPCAGEGVALARLAAHLKLPPGNAHAVELAEGRVAALGHDHPSVRLLGPASFLGGVGISANAFSLVYCNPPYGDQYGGGGRVEIQFLPRAITTATIGGLVILVVPEEAALGWDSHARAFRRTLASRLSGVEVWTFPDEFRKYREIVIFGLKRRYLAVTPDGPLAEGSAVMATRAALGPLGGSPAASRFQLPLGRVPGRWAKLDYAPGELGVDLATSPIVHVLDRPATSIGVARPPLPPGRGHVALLLAGGRLNGVVRPPGSAPHVVRGTARKVTVPLPEQSEATTDESGRTTTKDVTTERIALVVRTAEADGTLREFRAAE